MNRFVASVSVVFCTILGAAPVLGQELSTDRGIPDAGGWSGASVTKKAACPPGAFVVGIQGFKSDILLEREGFSSHAIDTWLSVLRVTCSDGSIDGTHQDMPLNTSWDGFSGTHVAKCNSGIIDIHGFKGDRPIHNMGLGSHTPFTGLSLLRLSCADGSVAATDPVNDIGSIPGFSGTYVAKCPPNTRVVAIEGFKAEGQRGPHPELVQIRLTCG